jgi:hypothetical protein
LQPAWLSYYHHRWRLPNQNHILLVHLTTRKYTKKRPDCQSIRLQEINLASFNRN